MIPKRRTRPRMNVRVSSVVRCPSHLKWVRGHECCISGGHFLWEGVVVVHICEGKIEAHHVREGDRGAGMGQKPGDDSVVPLCSQAHKRLHDKGSKTFEREWSVDLGKIADELWRVSPHGQRYRKQQESQ